MKLIARMGVVIAGVFTLAATGAGTSYADGYGSESGDWDLNGYASSEHILHIGSGYNCRASAACINGAANSGNIRNSQNVYMSGNNSNSGSPSDDNGLVNSRNETQGARTNSSNNYLWVGRGRGYGNMRAGGYDNKRSGGYGSMRSGRR